MFASIHRSDFFYLATATTATTRTTSAPGNLSILFILFLKRAEDMTILRLFDINIL